MKGQQQGKAKTSSWKSWRSPKGKTSAGRKTTPGKGSAKIVNRPTPSKNKTKFCLPSYLSSTVELPSIKTDKNSSLQKEVTIRTQMGMTPGQPESLSASSPSGTSEKGKKGKPAAASAALEQSRTTKSNKRNSGVQRKVTKLANNFKKDIKMKSSTSKSKSACQWKATQCKAPKRWWERVRAPPVSVIGTRQNNKNYNYNWKKLWWWAFLLRHWHLSAVRTAHTHRHSAFPVPPLCTCIRTTSFTNTTPPVSLSSAMPLILSCRLYRKQKTHKQHTCSQHLLFGRTEASAAWNDGQVSVHHRRRGCRLVCPAPLSGPRTFGLQFGGVFWADWKNWRNVELQRRNHQWQQWSAGSLEHVPRHEVGSSALRNDNKWLNFLTF